MIALLDADLFVWRVGATTNEEEEFVSLTRVDELITRILSDLNTTEYVMYLSSQDKSNFRYKIDPEYKAHRADVPKPKHFNLLREHLISKWKADVIFGMEADDALGIRQREDTVIVSLDKDLDQIPGLHFNFVKQSLYSITEEQGRYHFWWQMLVGDVADNIKCVSGIGKVRANKYLEGCETDSDFFCVVGNLYAKDYDDPEDRLLRNGKLLYILQEPNTTFTFPTR